MTRNDPGCRKLRARQRMVRMALRRQGKLALAGYSPIPGDCVTRIWRAHGWKPVEHVVITTEVRRAA